MISRRYVCSNKLLAMVFLFLARRFLYYSIFRSAGLSFLSMYGPTGLLISPSDTQTHSLYIVCRRPRPQIHIRQSTRYIAASAQKVCSTSCRIYTFFWAAGLNVRSVSRLTFPSRSRILFSLIDVSKLLLLLHMCFFVKGGT